MNRVFVDGRELFDVTVTITQGVVIVTPNSTTANATPTTGGGPGEGTH